MDLLKIYEKEVNAGLDRLVNYIVIGTFLSPVLLIGTLLAFMTPWPGLTFAFCYYSLAILVPANVLLALTYIGLKLFNRSKIAFFNLVWSLIALGWGGLLIALIVAVYRIAMTSD